MITFHKAFAADAFLITELARDIYKEHYLHLWDPGGADWYMEEYAYNFEKIEKDLKDPGIEYFIAFDEGTAVGYMKLALTALLTGYENFAALEVERIYLYKRAAGKGIGRQFMGLAMQKAIELKKEIIFLKAMDSSFDAIEFYKKLGYELCGNLQLPLPEFLVMKEAYRGMVILKIGVQE